MPGALIAAALLDGAFRSLEFNALTATFLQALPRFGMQTVGRSKGALSLGLSFLGALLAGALLGGLSFHALFGAVIVLMPAPNALMALVGSPPPRHVARHGTLASLASHTVLIAKRRFEEIILACYGPFGYGLANKRRTYTASEAPACLSSPSSHPLSWTRSLAALRSCFWRPPGAT